MPASGIPLRYAALRNYFAWGVGNLDAANSTAITACGEFPVHYIEKTLPVSNALGDISDLFSQPLVLATRAVLALANARDTKCSDGYKMLPWSSLPVQVYVRLTFYQ